MEMEWDKILADNSSLPLDMRFSSDNVVAIATYSVLMLVSAVGNLTVLCTILHRKTRSRIHLMLMHLAIADLLVTFLMMPMEIGWAATVSWRAGDAACRILSFFRTFGLYLSGFVLVCISIDRYYAVLKPMNMHHSDKRGRVMLRVAWALSVLSSLPQVVVFHVESHPYVTWYTQCVDFHAFHGRWQAFSYHIFGLLMMYGLPLVVIIFSYASIMMEIWKRSHDVSNDTFRRSSLGYLGRAKIRTLKMTIMIVVVFLVCWTPYYVMCLWHWLDKVSAQAVDLRVQRGLFMFACTNSCMNPLVYGLFNIRQRQRGAQSGTSQQQQSPNDWRLGRVKWLVSWRKMPALPHAVCISYRVNVKHTSPSS